MPAPRLSLALPPLEAQRRSPSPRPPPPSPLSPRGRPPREQAPPPGPTPTALPRGVNRSRARSARGTDQSEGGAGGLDLPLADGAHRGPHHRRCHHAPPPRPLPSAMGTTDVTPRHHPSRRASAIRPHWAAECDWQAAPSGPPLPAPSLPASPLPSPPCCAAAICAGLWGVFRAAAPRLVHGDKLRAGPGPARGAPPSLSAGTTARECRYSLMETGVGVSAEPWSH